MRSILQQLKIDCNKKSVGKNANLGIKVIHAIWKEKPNQRFKNSTKSTRISSTTEYQGETTWKKLQCQQNQNRLPNQQKESHYQKHVQLLRTLLLHFLFHQLFHNFRTQQIERTHLLNTSTTHNNLEHIFCSKKCALGDKSHPCNLERRIPPVVEIVERSCSHLGDTRDEAAV